MKTLRRWIAVAAMAAVVCVAAEQGRCYAQANNAATAITDRYLMPVQTELISKIDTKNASVGQTVTARTIAPAELADGTKMPKGTMLVGRVTQVQAHTEARAGAVLGLTFDYAELAGQKLRLRAVIQAIAPPPQVLASDAKIAPTPPGLPAGATGGISAGLGGAGGAARGVGPTGRSAVGSLASPTRGALGSTVPVVQAGENVSGFYATKLPGVMLSRNVPTNASGTLTAAGRDVSLERGTRITLGAIRQ